MPSFLIDENLPRSLAEAPSAAGLFAECVVDNEELRSSADEELMEFARVRGLILISKDREFSDITRYPMGSHPGVVSVRLPNRMRIDEQIRLVVASIVTLDYRDLDGSLIIVEAGKIRIRKT